MLGPFPYKHLSDYEVEEQLETIPEGPKRELARWMSAIYESDFGYAWSPDPSYDLLGSEPAEWAVMGDGIISEEDKEGLREMRDDAGGWFYEKDGKLTFVTLAEWELVKEAGKRTTWNDPYYAEQIRSMPEGPKRDLADWMNMFYGFGDSPDVEPTFDDTLIAYTMQAGGTFFVDNGRLLFWPLTEEQIDKMVG